MKYLHFYIIEYFLNKSIDIFRYSTDKERLRPRYKRGRNRSLLMVYLRISIGLFKKHSIM